MTTFTIKKVLTADVHKHDLIAMFDAYRCFYGMQGDMAVASKFIENRVERGESTIFLAHEDNSKSENGLGFVQLYPLFSSVTATRTWVLNDLFVMPSTRNAGIGTALMNAAEEFARETRASVVTLETAADNINAQRLYESLGYRKTAEGSVCHYCLDIE